MIKIKDVKEKVLFTYKGKKYQFINYNQNWRQLHDENGELIKPKDIPVELLLGKTEVEIVDD